jgi:hypothetical protein
LPVILAVFAAVLTPLGFCASFFGPFTAQRNAQLGIFSFLDFVGGGIFICNLLPRTILYLTGWSLGWTAWYLRGKFHE